MISHIERFISGDDASGDAICTSLEGAIRSTVYRVLSPGDADCDDLIQESLLAFLRYLRKAQAAPDQPEAFVRTVARNRCVNLQIWRRRHRADDITDFTEKLASSENSPLDLMESEERKQLINETILRLDSACQELLQSIYRGGATIEAIRGELGLGSVQAVYHRRNVCIKKAQALLMQRLSDCQSQQSASAQAGRTQGLDSGADHV